MVLVSFFRFPINFLRKHVKKRELKSARERIWYGQFFFPQHEIKRAQAKKMFEIIVEKEGLDFLDGVQFRYSGGSWT